jgi:K(+)-stimulated pyrophosphate-energized sodium pump
VITCGTLAGAIIPELVKVFTSVELAARARSGDVVARRRRVAEHSVRPGGRQLQRLLAGHGDDGADGIAYWISTLGLGALMLAPAVFAFGLVAFGFLGMGPVTIAVDSYGPVTDNAQSVYELSLIEQHSQHQEGNSRRTSDSTPDFEKAKRIWKRTTARATRSRPPPSRC